MMIFKDRLSAAGFDQNRPLLYNIAVEQLRKSGGNAVAASRGLADEARDAGGILAALIPSETILSHAQDFVARVAKDMTSPQGEAAAQLRNESRPPAGRRQNSAQIDRIILRLREQRARIRAERETQATSASHHHDGLPQSSPQGDAAARFDDESHSSVGGGDNSPQGEAAAQLRNESRPPAGRRQNSAQIDRIILRLREQRQQWKNQKTNKALSFPA